MVRIHGRRRGFGRGGRGVHASSAHGGHTKVSNSFQNVLPGKTHKQKHKHKQNPRTFEGKPAAGHTHSQNHSLENDLDNILYANTLAKHVDPPFTELEDDLSRLKTQSIELATLVLHLRNSLEVEKRRHKQSHPPEPIPLARSISPDSTNSGQIRTTTVKAPPFKSAQITAGDPLSIIYSSTPKRWSSRRAKAPSFPTPKTPGTAAGAGSPGCDPHQRWRPCCSGPANRTSSCSGLLRITKGASEALSLGKRSTLTDTL